MHGRNDALVEVLPDITRAARHVSLEWADVLDAEDIRQEIVVRLLEDNYAETLRDMEDRPRRKTLFKIGVQIAAGERVDYEHFSGQYRYSTDEVRERLERGALDSVGEDRLGTIAGDPAVAFSVEDVDVRHAFPSLTENHQDAIRYWLSKDRGPLTAAERMTVTRAVDALTHELNRAFRRRAEAHDGPGSRKAMSNARARVANKAQEDR